MPRPFGFFGWIHVDTMNGSEKGGTVTEEEHSTEDAEIQTDAENPIEDAEITTDAETTTEPLGEARKGGKFFKRVFWLGVIVGAGVAVAYAMNQRQKLAAMSDDEIRAMLEEKLGGRVADEQLVEIQNTVISKVRGTSATTGTDTASVTGTVTYREKIAMPLGRGGHREAAGHFVDGCHRPWTSGPRSSRVAAPFRCISPLASTRPRSSTTTPTRCAPPSRRATTLLWTTDTAYPVITRGNPLTADLLLIAVPQPVSD